MVSIYEVLDKQEGVCVNLPDNGGGHGLLHIVVECVTAFAGEDIIDMNGAITFGSSDVLVIPVESDAESRRSHITQRVLMSDLYLRVLCGHNLVVGIAGRHIFLRRFIGHHVC